MKNFTTTRSTALLIASVVLTAGLTACSQSSSPENILKSARTAVENKDVKAAEIHLKNLLQKSPDNAEARYLLGSVYYQAGDFRGAEKEFHRAIEGGFDRSKTVPTMFHSMLQIGDFQKIIDEHKNLAVEGAATKARVLDQVARAYSALNKRTEAEAAFREALTLQPNLPAARAGLIGLDANKDRISARAQLDALLKESPESFEAWILNGDLHLADNNLPLSRDAFAKAAALDTNNALSRAKLGAILIDLKEYPAAKTQIAELRRIAPNSPASLHLTALYEFRQGNLTQARDAIQLAVKAAPDYLPAIALSGNIYLNLGQNEQAERQGRMLIERAPTSVQGYRLMGAAYLRMNAPERALALIMPLIERGTRDATLFTIAGEAYLKSNEPTKAGLYFDQALQLDPNDPSKRTGLALSRMAGGEREKAFDDLEAAVKLDTAGHQADFALIMARVREKQFDKALEAVGNLEKKQPQNPLTHNLRGMVLLAKNDSVSARKSFEQALVLDPAFFPAAANLASLEMRENKPAEARKRYESVLAKDPKNAQALIALARHVARTGGNKQEVQKILTDAKQANPGAAPPIMALANFLLENNQPRDAIPLLQEGLQQNPDRTDLLDLLSVAYLRVNERSQAIETFDKLLRLDPKSPALHYRMGELKVATRDDNGALTAFRRAAELSPKAVEPRIAIASILLRTGKKEEARTIATELKRDLPASPAGQLLEGDLLAADQQWAAAAGAFRKAWDLLKNPVTAGKLHQSLTKAGKGQEANTFINDAVAADPKNVGLRLYAGEIAIAQEKWQAATEHYKIMLAQEPNHGLALNNMAWASFKLNDPNAVKYAEQAFAALPQSPPVIDTLGYILLKTGKASRGTELLRQAIAMSPKSVEIRIHLAEALQSAGDKESAKRELDTALRDANTPELQAKVKDAAAKL